MESYRVRIKESDPKNVSLSGTPEYEEKYIYFLVMYLLYGVLQGKDKRIWP